jgi:hypothetical protein
MRVDANAYLRTSVPTTQEEIRMTPTSWTVIIIEAGNPDKHIQKATSDRARRCSPRRARRINTVVAPHPGKNAKVMICAEGYQQKDVDVNGVLQTVELTPGTPGCTPLPSPSPSASPSPSGSPAASAFRVAFAQPESVAVRLGLTGGASAFWRVAQFSDRR